MSLVTLADKQLVLGLIGAGSPAQDRLLLSLAHRTTWTSNQRDLVERMCRASRSGDSCVLSKS